MILVFQIAAGIVLGGLILGIIASIFSSSPSFDRAIGNFISFIALLAVFGWGLINHTAITITLTIGIFGGMFVLVGTYLFYERLASDNKIVLKLKAGYKLYNKIPKFVRLAAGILISFFSFILVIEIILRVTCGHWNGC
jgi:hypothetical protein